MRLLITVGVLKIVLGLKLLNIEKGDYQLSYYSDIGSLIQKLEHSIS